MRLGAGITRGLVYFFAFFACVPAFAEYEELASFDQETQDSVLRLSAANQEALQKYFDGIYAKIRLPTDPVVPPKVFLSKKKEFAAYVVPTVRRDVVFFHPEFLLTAPSTDAIAFVYAHEITHFDKRQDAHRNTAEGEFLNEVDADIRGAAQRITRVGLYDDEGKHQAAAYSLESIAEWLKSNDRFSSSHPNSKNIGTVLAGLFVKQRYLRRFPAVTKSKGPILPMAPAIVAAALLATTARANVQDHSVRERVRREGRWIRRHPFSIALEELRWLERHGASASPVEKSQHFMDLHWGMSYAWSATGHYSEETIAGWAGGWGVPKDFFRRAARQLDEYAADGLHSHQHYLAALAKMEENLELLAKGQLVLTEGTVDRSYQTEHLATSLLRRQARMLRRRAKTHPLETMVLVSAGGNVAMDDPALERVFQIAAKNVPVASIATLATDPKFGGRFFLLLDKGESTHRLPQSVRRIVVERLSQERGYNPTIFSLMQYDPVLLREEIQRRLASGFPGDVLGLRQAVMNRFPVPEMDSAMAEGIRKQLEMIKAESNVNGREMIEDLLHDVERVRANPTGAPLLGSRSRNPITADAKRAAANTGAILQYLLGAQASDVDLVGTALHISPRATGFDPMYDDFKDTASVRWMGQALDFVRNKMTFINDMKALFGRYDDGKIIYPQSREAALEVVHRYLPKFLQSEMDVPWAEVIPKISPAQFLSLLVTRDVGSHRTDFPQIAEQFQLRFAQFLQQKQFTPEVEFAALSLLANMVKGGSPASVRLLTLVEERVRQANSRDATLKYLGAIPPQMFPTPGDYADFASRLLAMEVHRMQAELSHPATRPAAIEQLTKPIKETIAESDPALRQILLDRVAEGAQATPAEKSEFQVSVDPDQATGRTLQYGNAILEAYEDLPANMRWRFLQFLRGKSDGLFVEPPKPGVLRKLLEGLDDWTRIIEVSRKMMGGEEGTLRELREWYESDEEGFRSRISWALKQNKIFVPPEDIESYLRFHFKGLPTLARGVFFQVALEGKKGLLKEPGFRKRILNELIDSMPREIRPVIRRLHGAAVKALPPAYENLILAVAFSESGDTGSPEIALRTIFQNMGPLVQKFGQTLAFDPRLPESYRKELMKLWDEGVSPGWWKVAELIQRQYGDIWAAGFRMVKIRNSGTTEIVVELEGPNGERRITAVQREALEIGADVDNTDLRRFVEELSRGWGNEIKWGWMNVLVRDAAETMGLEMDSDHKRKITSEMSAAYDRAARRIRADSTGNIPRLDIALATVTYADHDLPDGRKLVTQNVAAGIPLKNLERTHPELYRQINQWLVALENEVQNDPTAPIDKDRMPGQVLVDISNPNRPLLTLLDFGQAKHIDPKVTAMRNHFTGATLATNGAEVAKSLESLGVKLSGAQQGSLAAELGRVEAAYRPLQALEWLHRNGFGENDKLGRYYDDLTHAIRAKIRLGQWEQSVGAGFVREEWTELGRAHHSIGRFFTSSKDDCGPGMRKLADEAKSNDN